MATDPGLRRLALRTLLAAFRGPDAAGVGGRPRRPRDWPAYTLFGFNIARPATRSPRRTAALRAARAGVLVAIDEEGGDVTRLAHRTGSPYPGNAALGALDDVDGDPRGLPRDRRGAGRPSASTSTSRRPSTSTPPTTTPSSVRGRFGADPPRVAAHAAAAVDGLQEAGVAACAKHFPGHGATIADSHLELPTVDVPARSCAARDLPPFAAVIGAGIQVDHDRAHPGAGADRRRCRPRSAGAVLVDLLRGELGFTGCRDHRRAGDEGRRRARRRHRAGGAARAGRRRRPAVHRRRRGRRPGRGGAPPRSPRPRRRRHGWTPPGSRRPPARTDGAGRLGLAARARAEPATGASGTTPRGGRSGWRASLRRAGRRRWWSSWRATSTIAEGRVPWGLGPHLDGTEQIRVVAGDDRRADELLARAGGRPIVVVGPARAPAARRDRS